MRRTLLVAVALFGGACHDEGTYDVSWSFGAASAPDGGTSGDSDAGAAQPIAAACGAHGVAAIRIIAASTSGDRDDVSGPCVTGTLSHTVPTGTWTVTLEALDARGRPQMPVDASTACSRQATLTVTLDPVSIGKNMNVPLPPVSLVPLGECCDGVDNDHDGRVDGDDPDCQNGAAGPE